MKIKQSISKIECEICSKLSTVQLFYKSNGKLSYGRSRHYTEFKEGKANYIYHQQSLGYLQQKLLAHELELGNSTSIDMNKAISSSELSNKEEYGAAERTRTFDLLINSQLHYLAVQRRQTQ